MATFRTLRSRYFHTLIKPQNSSRYLGNPLHSTNTTTHYISSNSYKPSLISSIFPRPISLSAQFETESTSLDNSKEDNKKTKKPLHVLFKEAVGLSGKLEHSDIENEFETNELKKKLRKLEEEVRRLKENHSERQNVRNLKKKSRNDAGVSMGESSSKSLYALFAKEIPDSEKSADMKSLRMEDEVVYKELSSELVPFVTHLYKEGYFNNANFLPSNKFDVCCFENSYGRDFIKYAAEKFGKDYQEIAKWLSASDLKNVALFGCPSLGRKTIFSAKRLRTFFGIQEDTVCSKCVLKTSCKFVNQSVWKGDKNLNLAVVMRVIILYALESVPPQLVVPEDVKASVSRLLKEALNLSQTLA